MNFNFNTEHIIKIENLPADISDRELHNIFTFSNGFLGSLLKDQVGYVKYATEKQAHNALNTLSNRKISNEHQPLKLALLSNIFVSKLINDEEFHSYNHDLLTLPLSINVSNSSTDSDSLPSPGPWNSIVDNLINDDENPTTFSSQVVDFAKSQSHDIFSAFSKPSNLQLLPNDRASKCFKDLITKDVFSSNTMVPDFVPSEAQKPQSYVKKASSYIPAGDQNPPCNTLYVGNLPINTTEDELRQIFSESVGYKRLCLVVKNLKQGPMCFVEFQDEDCAAKAIVDYNGAMLSGSSDQSGKRGIRLSFSKNPLGVRRQPQQGAYGGHYGQEFVPSFSFHQVWN